jgi:hypothetical protein
MPTRFSLRSVFSQWKGRNNGRNKDHRPQEDVANVQLTSNSSPGGPAASAGVVEQTEPHPKTKPPLQSNTEESQAQSQTVPAFSARTMLHLPNPYLSGETESPRMPSFDQNHSSPKVDELLDRLTLLFDQHTCKDAFVMDKWGVGHFVYGELEHSLCAIARELGEIGDRRAVPILCTRLENNCRCFSFISSALINALGAIRDSRAVPVLCAQLGRDNPERLKDLALALERIDDPSALPALRAVDPGPIDKPKPFYGGDDRDDDRYSRRLRIYDAHNAIKRFESRHRGGLVGWRRQSDAKPGQGTDWVQSGFRYCKGDLVKYKETYYRCMAGHDSSSFVIPDEREPRNAGHGYWKKA